MNKNRVILDTDIGSDVSDLCAAFLYWQAAKKGYIHPQGVLLNTGNVQGLKCLALAQKYSTGNVNEIGALGTSFLNYSMNWKYTRYLVDEYQLTETATQPYVPYFRKALAEAPDQSVTIVCNGPMRGLAQLLLSEADEMSPLDGSRLIYQKVKKLIVSSGRFDTGKDLVYPRRSGWDVWSYTQTSMYIDWDVASARIVDDQWPTPIEWVGCEVGHLNFSGERFLKEAAEDHPLRLAYHHFTKGSAHVSGPQLALLMAIPDFAKDVVLSPEGRVLMNNEGKTEFNPYPGGRDRRVMIETQKDIFKRIDELLLA